MKLICKALIYTGILVIIGILGIFLLTFLIQKNYQKYKFSKTSDLPGSYTVLVLGAHVNESGVPSEYLKDRLEAAFELYRLHKAKRFLLSGDHGRKGYDEVNTMKQYLLNKGVDTADVFLDHAGFDTYNSIVRAKEIFKVSDLIIVTQDFHLPRALYIARKKGLEAYGFVADKQKYKGIARVKFREKLALVKAFFEVTFNRSPRFLGDSIPITGDSRRSYD